MVTMETNIPWIHTDPETEYLLENSGYNSATSRKLSLLSAIDYKMNQELILHYLIPILFVKLHIFHQIWTNSIMLSMLAVETLKS